MFRLAGNLNLEQTFNKLMDRYLNCILNIKNIYNNKIVILSPNPPLETYTNENLIMGSKEDRMLCQKLFDSFWKKHDDVVHYINWTKKYQKDKLEFAMMEKLYELHQEQQLDLHTGDITQDEYNKLQEKMTNKLAHLHLVS